MVFLLDTFQADAVDQYEIALVVYPTARAIRESFRRLSGFQN